MTTTHSISGTPRVTGASPRARRRTAPILVTSVALAALLTACGGSDTVTSWGPAGSGVSGRLAPRTSSSTTPTISTAAPSPPASGRAAPPVGTDPSNAAFDPCRVITWDDFPQKVARPDRRPPQPQPPPPNALYRVGCLWDSRGSSTKDPQTGQEHHMGVSIVVIYWGTAPPLSTLPADHPGGVAKTYAGRPGVELGGTMQTGERKCTAMMPVQPQPGVAGISVAYSDPAVDPCAVATTLLQAIAKVVP